MNDIYYKNEFVTLYKGDCLSVIPDLGEQFNLLILDPPYSGLKSEAWDKINHAELETMLRNIFKAVKTKMKKNAALYCFCWPYFSAKLQRIISDYFNVLNEIIWMKRRATGAQCGRQARADISTLRKFFPETERIIFAEMCRGTRKGSDYISSEHATDDLRSEIMREMIEYFANAKHKSGMTGKDIRDRIYRLTGKRYVFCQHCFCASQWELPTRDQYEAAKTFLPLPLSYDELRKKYEEAQRIHTPCADNFTDLWIYSPVLAGSKERTHSCQKPLRMIKDMIRTSTRKNDIILDPCAGSGVTAIAAMRTGRRAILIEQDEKYCSEIALRCESEHPNLFL